MTPELAIIIPTFRRPALLHEALQGLLSLQELTIEVVVLDDSPEGSARNIVKGLQDPRVRYVHPGALTEGRPAVLRNRGAQLTGAPILYFFDDDDLVIPDALVAAVRMLAASPAGVAVCVPHCSGPDPARVAQEQHFFARARAVLEAGPTPLDLAAHLIMRDPVLVSSTCLVKRTVHEAIKGWDESMPVCEDTDYFARAIEQHGWHFAQDTFVQRRVGHLTVSSTASHEDVSTSYANMRASFRARLGTWQYLRYRLNFRLKRAH